MTANLNEQYLLKFLYKIPNETFDKKSDLIELLEKFNIKIKPKNYKELFNIIDELENE